MRFNELMLYMLSFFEKTIKLFKSITLIEGVTLWNFIFVSIIATVIVSIFLGKRSFS